MFRNSAKKLEKIVALLSIFLIPSQLALHFWPSFSFVFGIRVDYLAPAVYLTDILVLLLICLWFLNNRKSFVSFIKERKTAVVFLTVFILINTLFSSSVWVTAIKWMKILEMVLFALYIYFRKSFIGGKPIIKSLFYSSMLFSVIGIIQFFWGRTTGLFYVLGERSFNLTTPGIALVQISGRDFMRAYSTLPHPNALAGYLGVILLLLVASDYLKESKYLWVGLFVLVLSLVLTFSLTGLLGLAFALFVYSLRKRKKIISVGLYVFVWISIIFSLLLPMFSNQKILRDNLSKNLVERLDLSILSGKMISSRFITGGGLNTFVVNIPVVGKGLMSPWLLQPVHNIYLLVFTETGIFGLLILIFVIFSFIKKLLNKHNPLLLMIFVFILFTGLTDHYWLTLQQNLLVLSLVLGFL